MTFLRRVDDAICVMRYGHARRDWDRVRIRRLRLLVQKEMRKLDREAARHDDLSFYATSCRLSAQALARRLERIVNRVDCDAYRVLLDHLLIERSNLHARRIFQWDDWHALDDFNKTHIESPVVPMVDPASKQYGKLLKGLGQRFAFDPLHDKRRFHIRYWHRLLAPLLQLSARRFRSTKVVSPP